MLFNNAPIKRQLPGTYPSNTGKIRVMNAQELAPTALPSMRDIRRRLEQMDISADAKVTLLKLAETVTTVGSMIVQIGRRIVAFALDLIRQFPHIGFCVMVAVILSSLISAIPLFGAILSPFIGPLLIAAGVAAGAAMEIQEGGLRER